MTLLFRPFSPSAVATDQFSAYFDGNDYLEFTPLSEAPSTNTWTFRTKARRNSLGSSQTLFSGWQSDNDYFHISFNPSNQLYIQNRVSASNICLGTTTELYRDTNAFYTVMLVCNNGVFTLYVNDVEQTLSASGSAGHTTVIGKTYPHTFGLHLGTSWYFDGEFNDTYYINNQALTPADFNDNGFTGTYGSHDVYLDYNNAFRLGDDVAHTVDGYATLNPNDHYSVDTFANSNKTFTESGGSDGGVRATLKMPATGKWYWEATLDNFTLSNAFTLGIHKNPRAVANATYAGFYSDGYGLVCGTGVKENNGSTATYGAGNSTLGSIWMVAYDADIGSLYFGLNGQWADGAGNFNQTWDGAVAAYTGLSGSFFPSFGDRGSTSLVTATVAFDDAEWTYTAPTGFKALNVANLPEPSTYNTNEHFEVLTYTGNGGTQTIKGTDWGDDDQLVWIKSRSNTYSHGLFDSVRGATKKLYSDLTNAEVTESGVTLFNSDGFDLGTAAGTNNNGSTYVAWRFRAGTSASNTDGTITSTVSHNPTLGFSIVKWSSNASPVTGETIGHGGNGKKPCLIIVKQTSTTGSWIVYHSSKGANYHATLNSTSAGNSSSESWGQVEPTGSVFSVGPTGWTTNEASSDYIAYVFFESDLVKPFLYTGNGSTDGPFVYTNGEPLWHFFKNTNTSIHSWFAYDRVRSQGNNADDYLRLNSENVEGTQTNGIYNDTGFKTTGTDAAYNANGDVYIGLCIVGQQPQVTLTGNDFDNIGAAEQVSDNPTDTIATLNPLLPTNVTYSEANTKAVTPSSGFGVVMSSLALPTDKTTYFEVLVSGSGATQIGICRSNHDLSLPVGQDGTTDNVSYYSNGNKYVNNVASGYASSYGDTAVIGVEFTGSTVKFYTDGVDNGVAASGLTGQFFAAGADGSNSQSTTLTFRFDSSEWTHTPPGIDETNQLSTANLPTPANTDVSQHFETLLWAGNSSTQNIVGTDWGTDDSLVWIKRRNVAASNELFDTIRGVTKALVSDTTQAELTLPSTLTAFNNDGFTLGGDTGVNATGYTYVAWRFRAGTAATDNTGSISATVSANQTLGFSIVKYTGNGTGGATVAHGLGKAPKLIIVKNLTDASNWLVYYSGEGANKYGYLNLQNAWATDSTGFHNVEPTSSVFSVGTANETNGSGDNIIAYCFTDSDFIDIGTYTGTGSSGDAGPFAYTDGAPEYLLAKYITANSPFHLNDKTRNPINGEDKKTLYATTADTEISWGGVEIDFLSTGMKLREPTGYGLNYSGGEMLYLTIKKPFGGTVQLRAE